MTWVKLDDHFPDHPKVHAARPLAAWLHVAALGYCSRYLTDGLVPATVLASLARFEGIRCDGRRVDPVELAAVLVETGMWERDGHDYRIHDYLDYNPSRAEVLVQRQSTRDRVAKHRDKKRGGNSVTNAECNAVSNAVSNGEGNALVTPPPYPNPNPNPKQDLDLRFGDNCIPDVSVASDESAGQRPHFQSLLENPDPDVQRFVADMAASGRDPQHIGELLSGMGIDAILAANVANAEKTLTKVSGKTLSTGAVDNGIHRGPA